MIKRKFNLAVTLLILSGLSTLSAITRAEPSSQFQEKLAQYQGKVVYVDFWASWCTPCRRSFPWMNEMKAKYQAQGFEIISVNLDSEAVSAQHFLRENNANFDVIYDPEGVLAKKYQIKGMPSSFILDRQSNVTSVHVGFTDKKKSLYQQEIVNLLSKDVY